MLARLQRQYVSGLPIDVERLADDPSGHTTDVVQARRDQAQVRPPVVQMVAEGLTLPDGDVGTELARRREHAERERVEDLDGPRSPIVGPAEQFPYRLKRAVDVGMLHDDGGHVGVDLGSASPPVRDGEDLGLVPRSPPVGAQRVHQPRVDRSGDEHAIATVSPRHVDRLDERRGAVVERRVRDLEARQLADHGLELEQRLQHALRELRLVRRI